MRSVSVLVLAFVLFLTGCKNNDPVSPDNLNKGNITFKIDRENAPENVSTITATLTRSGFQNISSTMNLISDTTADLTLSGIPVGPWHLKVEAFDTSGVVVYSGETDVTILEGITIQVNLTLVPTGNGYGNIYIFVKWGTNSTSIWNDYENNPIMTNSQSTAIYIFHPKVIFDENKYKMWYAGIYGAGYMNTWYAESNDGLQWTTIGNQPVLSPTPGAWDSQRSGGGPVIKDGSIYRMYYSGGIGSYDPWHIGLAVSTDGVNWEKYPNPILYASVEEFQITPSSVVKYNDLFYLYYTVRNNGPRLICAATSPDGINWTKSANNPILVSTQSWEGSGISHPAVIVENNNFKMVYQNNAETGFGMASSTDGINWIKDTNNPFFKSSDTHNHWCYNISYPNYCLFGNQYRIYYTGVQNNGISTGVTIKN